MPFPKYKTTTKKRKFLFWTWKEEYIEKDEWKDICSTVNEKIGRLLWCRVCGSTMRIGEENEERFIYCPGCLKKYNHSYY